MNDIPKRYLDIDEAATYLGFKSPKSIYKLVAARSIPFIKPGGLETLRFDIKALDKWMERQAVPAKSHVAA